MIRCAAATRFRSRTTPFPARVPAPVVALSVAAVLAFLAGVPARAVEEGDPSLPGGRWEGWLRARGKLAPMALRTFPGGALLDLPEEAAYGLPLVVTSRSGGGVDLSMPGSDGGSGGAAIRFSASLSPGGGGETPALGGRFARGADEGHFELVLSAAASSDATRYAIDTGNGSLPATLLVPPGPRPVPLALLIANPGGADRDGNNRLVPGRCDSLKQLAEALLERGVASCRYDQRGAGEAFPLVSDESELRFGDHVEDAVAAIRALEADARFGRVVVVGHAEGALVAAAALNRAGAAVAASNRAGVKTAALNGAGVTAAALNRAGAADGKGAGPGTRAATPAGADRRGLVLLCASGRSALDSVREAIGRASAEIRAEGESILEALARGELVSEPGPYFADFFRPSFQPYLASWFSFELAAEIGAAESELLMAHGGRDLQVGPEDFALLVESRPDAAAFALPGMQHALKEVGPEEEENYRAFSEPSIPLAEGLADLVAAFAAERPLREEPGRYSRWAADFSFLTTASWRRSSAPASDEALSSTPEAQ